MPRDFGPDNSALSAIVFRRSPGHTVTHCTVYGMGIASLRLGYVSTSHSLKSYYMKQCQYEARRRIRAKFALLAGLFAARSSTLLLRSC